LAILPEHDHQEINHFCLFGQDPKMARSSIMSILFEDISENDRVAIAIGLRTLATCLVHQIAKFAGALPQL
jgi:hypothetical protein